MSQRTALVVATALTVFVMITMVGLAWQVFQKSTISTLALQESVPAQPTDSVTAPEPVAAPTEQEQIAQREAAFQQMIQQANQQLEQAYKQQQDLTKELAAERKNKAANAPAAVSQQPKYNVTAEQAASIALAAEQGAVLLKPAELISFQGTAAYEVTLDRGLVYVDANTGKVIYDSAAAIVVRDGGGSGGSGGNRGGGSPSVSAPKSGGHENEHESENHNESSRDSEHEGEHGGD